jgi:hypothetical protein
MTKRPNKPQFLLLLRQPNDGAGPTPEELRHIMGRFGQWMQGLSARGMVVSTNGLDYGGATLRGSRGASVTDGPYIEAKEIVGGYVLITADDLAQAIEVARDCPGLDFRMAVEVRPVKSR